MNKLIISLLLSIQLSACSDLKQSFEQNTNLIKIHQLIQQNTESTPNWLGEQQSVTLPTRYSGEHMLVPVSINGVDGFEFLISLGESQTLLVDSPKVRALKLHTEFEVKLPVPEDHPEQVRQVSTGNKIQLGPLEFTNQTIMIGDGVQIWRLLDKRELRYDGIIGSYALAKAIAQVDPDKQTFTLAKDFSALNNLGFEKLDIELLRGEHPIVPVTIQQEGLQPFHTNLRWSGGLMDALILSTQGNIRLKTPEQQIYAEEVGYHMEANIGRLKYLNIGTFKLNQPIANFADFPLPAPTISGTLGGRTINRFHVIYNLAEKQLWLKPASKFSDAFQLNRTGIEANKMHSGGFIIHAVNKPSPAANTKMKKGDYITAINDVDANDISLQEYTRLTSTSDSIKIEINGQDEYILKLEPRI